MDENIVEIFKEVVPVIITGIFTFFITRYTYNKNIPLDKLEITYNRIYYPIYQLLYDKKLKDVITDISKISFYFQKYNKYVDRATLKAFDLFCKYKDEDTLQNFKNNIWNKNSYLRKRLGYLEPGILQMYTYSSKIQKFVIRVLLEILVVYFCIITLPIAQGTFKEIVIVIATLFLIVAIVEIICTVIYYLCYLIKKVIKKS